MKRFRSAVPTDDDSYEVMQERSSNSSRNMASGPQHDRSLATTRTHDCKRAHSEFQPDVERMITEYCDWNAVESLLDLAKSYLHGKERISEMVVKKTFDAVKRAEVSERIFHKRIHGGSIAGSKALRFDRMLVRFTGLFVSCSFFPRERRRFCPKEVPGLLKQKEKRRRERWLQDDDDTSQAEEDLLAWYRSFQQQMGPSTKRQQTDLGLKDLVFPLIDMIDLRSDIGDSGSHGDQRGSPSSQHSGQSDDEGNDWGVTTLLQELLAEMMLQSVLETYRKTGTCGDEDITSAFAWGPIHNENVRAECISSGDSTFERVFSAEKASDEPEWSELRLNFMLKLKLPMYITSAVDMGDPVMRTHEHLQRLQEQYPRAGFEKTMIHFLDSLRHAQDPPILKQLESGDRLLVDKSELSLEDEIRLRSIVQKSNH